ncbi:glycosyltransferase family 39 protein [Tissierella pigra]|nr:glycosyltransferase family 39 protein [Tissierella pigra]
MYSNNIINFPDTLGYLSVLNKMIISNSISFKHVSNYAGSLQVGYHYLNYFTYKIFNSGFSLYLINIFMYILSILFYHTHLRKRFNNSIATISTVVLTVSMYLTIFTSDILKDSLVLFLSMLSLHIYDKFIDVKKRRLIFFLIIVLGSLTTTRIYSGVGFAVGILVDFFILQNKKLSIKKLFFFITLIIGLVLISPLKAHFDMGLRFISRINMSSSFVINIISSTITFFLSPLFWNMTTEISVYTPIILDSMFFLIFSPLLLIYLYKFFRYKEYRERMYLYLIPILIHIIALGVEYGKTAIRQKIAVYPFLVLLYVFELYKIFKKVNTY